MTKKKLTKMITTNPRVMMGERSAYLTAQIVIENKILVLRKHKVMLDKDLADLYGVKTKVLKQAVNRNIHRFPEDFMFLLTKEEMRILRSQFVTSNWGGIRYAPYAFTEQGIAMLSSILNSERAILVNIQIMRAFVKLRELMISHKGLAQKIETLERKFKEHDKNFVIVFEAIKKLLDPPSVSKEPIGFSPRKKGNKSC